MQSMNSIQGFSSILPESGAPRNQASGVSSNSTSSSSNPSVSDGGIGATFLKLLTQELQNQDPTNPVDSTAMVGQMISLNQLDQLISINQILSKNSQSKVNADAVATAQAKGTRLPTPSQALGQTAVQGASSLPFDPNTLMPVDPMNPAGKSLKARVVGAANEYLN